MHKTGDGMPGKYRQAKIELSLFDMINDPMETTNVIEKYPEVAQKMISYAEAHNAKFFAEE